jgi:ferrochelatase
LAEFLWDRRAIDLPRALWWPILHFSVLRTRPRQSAKLYQKIWTLEGSPLATISAAQARGLQARLDRRHPSLVTVKVAMRYGNPSIARALDELAASGIDRIIALSMYPQYAGATIGSSLERLFEVAGPRRVVPSIRVIPPYFDEAPYIDALAAVARKALSSATPPPDHLLLSFHGLPKRYVTEGDPYPAQCRATADLLRRALDWPEDRFTLTFQSRFGREPWLEPYTDETLKALPARAVTSVAVMSPGFTADCLETLEEIGITGREQFLHAGGKDFVRIPCPNDDPAWLDAMDAIVSRELGGWI